MANDKITTRADWLNEHVFTDRPIDDDAIAAMMGMGMKRALELFKEIEEMGDQVKSPSGFLKSAARREGLGPGGAGGGGAQKSKGKGKGGGGAVVGGGGGGAAKGGGGARNGGRIANKAAWLNENLFQDRPIDDDAVAAMIGMGGARAMELFKEMEEKGDQVKNPSGYLKSAARKEGFGPQEGGGRGGDADYNKIGQRAQWLNDNVFLDKPIDADAIAAMVGMGRARAMELFKELQEKAGSMKNPSGYLKAAASREGFGPPEEPPQKRQRGAEKSQLWPVAIPAIGSAPAKGGKKGAGKGASQIVGKGAPPRAASAAGAAKLQKRVQWLNDNVFQEKPLSDDALSAVCELEVGKALELLKE
eukprot:CAMPEP_0177374656 /NCGR_PEP_ID=MMETSP0368-20130122/44274_1 /TAXON_ID=447022 ORGANISM="Scrippsiella hangoei-like, Strain SHHI-4" /NCGR_SAMPLE_ID=MMETSP0368 /ASSEMBLY_ACC=CAM_ASM_000363 /LENGTH=360 /DNA_ID=CAMNT_0018838267 /DNA_START=16 /DNA_END=1095 /DNA_ORIENTATION=-